MNTRIINIIISREYLNRVKKKSFLIITFLVPILFAAMCMLPALIMYATKEEGKIVAVVDQSGIVVPALEDTELVQYAVIGDMPLDSIKANLSLMGFDAVLSISALDADTKSVQADIFSIKPLGMDLSQSIQSRIDDAIEEYRIASYEIENLASIMQDVKSKIKLHTYTIGEDGKEVITESGVYMGVSMVLGIVIYVFVTLFGAMVMSSVIEEKSSRVVEVLISSVKATELMFGKIIGIALVALTQFFLWIILTGAIVGVAGLAMGSNISDNLSTEQLATMAGGTQVAGMDTAELVSSATEDGGLGVIMSSLANLPIGQILICFIIFFIFGYMIYASLFAAIGSAVENEGDSQQLQIPLTIPLMLGFFLALYAFKAPDSSLVFWGSIFPLTSPIVMLARLPFGVPTWEIILSIGLLILTFILLAWLSAKIYRVGILMFGKKSTWKDLWKWLKMS